MLVWSVSDPARGIIRASGGLTAVYEGQNVAEPALSLPKG
jgi:hypothetical protein